MKSKFFARASMTLALAVAMLGGQAAAQNAPSVEPLAAAAGGPTKIDRSIEYHGGPVLTGVRVVYFIFYGGWGSFSPGDPLAKYNDAATMLILTDFMSTVGNTYYAQINSTYTDSAGKPASASWVFGGAIVDNSYSRGGDLTQADLEAIIEKQVRSFQLPDDPQGIYVIFTSSDITLTDGARQFCLTCCNLHATGMIYGANLSYIFVGNPSRCPTGCATQIGTIASPNANYAADSMAAWLAHGLNGVVADPFDNAWYDRFGLENAEKCERTYGTTYPVTNADGQLAEANIQLGQRHFLLQQNWLNAKKGHCSMSVYQ